jgi:hypothetical protein
VAEDLVHRSLRRRAGERRSDHGGALGARLPRAAARPRRAFRVCRLGRMPLLGGRQYAPGPCGLRGARHRRPLLAALAGRRPRRDGHDLQDCARTASALALDGRQNTPGRRVRANFPIDRGVILLR